MGQLSAEGELRFQALTEADLPLLARWRALPHVARWFHGALSYEQTVAKFAPRIRGDDPVDGYVVHLGERAVGYIQSFRVRDHPAAAVAMQLDGDAYAIDMLLGDPALVGRGLGSRILRAFSERLLRDPRVDYLVIAPDAGNVAAIRAYERAGFVAERSVPSTHDERRTLLMVRRRRGEHVS